MQKQDCNSPNWITHHLPMAIFSISKNKHFVIKIWAFTLISIKIFNICLHIQNLYCIFASDKPKHHSLWQRMSVSKNIY